MELPASAKHRAARNKNLISQPRSGLAGLALRKNEQAWVPSDCGADIAALLLTSDLCLNDKQSIMFRSLSF